MDVASVHWLQTEDGRRVLDRAAALGEPDPLRARAALERACPGTASDLLAYGRALGTGEGLLSESAQMERLSSFRPGWTEESQYGQGMICRSGWVGHGGDTLGFHTDVYYNGEIDTTIVVLLNRYPSHEPQNIVTALAAQLGKPIAPLD